MSFESTIRSTILNDATLTSLCPSISTQQAVDNPTFPFAYYVFSRKDSLIFGAVATGISQYTFEFNCFAQTQSAVDAIASRVIALLDGFTSPVTYNTPRDVSMCRLDSEAQAARSQDTYIFYVKSLRFAGLGI